MCCIFSTNITIFEKDYIFLIILFIYIKYDKFVQNSLQ